MTKDPIGALPPTPLELDKPLLFWLSQAVCINVYYVLGFGKLLMLKDFFLEDNFALNILKSLNWRFLVFESN